MDSKLRKALHILESYNGVFRQLWELGKINFTKKIPRAGVAFNKEGKCIDFMFNPDFYKELDEYELAFIITHECMHVLLYHGRRMFANPRYTIDRDTFNVAADIAIHEIMYKEFGFERELIKVDHCTIETVFEEKASSIGECKTMDYYFDQLHEHELNCKTLYFELDSHMFGEGDDSGFDDLIKKAFARISDVEKKELKEKLKDVCQQRGEEKGGNWYDVEIQQVRKRKWEMVIKEFSQAFLQCDRFDWSRKARRFHGLSNKLFLPSHLELDIKKVDVWLFMDTSGSCINLASRFFSAAASLPNKFFNPKLFCFDTEVYPTSITSREVLGGGGTSFDIIEEYIQKNSNKYPDFVFVITDGYGNEVAPQYPNKWHVFLTSEYKDLFPQNSVFHSFEEFE